MKTLLPALFLMLLLTGCKSKQRHEIAAPVSVVWDSTDSTNDFFDNSETYNLKMTEIYIGGEVANPGKVDLSALPVHSVTVKETLLDTTGGNQFVGAYRYDGYSLLDILDRTVIKKANAKEFNPIIDLYVEIENDKGERTVFSWGEIFYANNLNRIIIAKSVARIIPAKSKKLWPLPEVSKIVSGNDLLTERNIPMPAKITVKSFPVSLQVIKGLSQLYSKNFSILDNGKKLAEIAPTDNKSYVYNTIFYGHGMGIRSTSPFKGILLKDVIQSYYPVSKENLRAGVICLAAMDGYRCTLTYSELFNRNDQQEFLLVRTKTDEDGGLFRTFAAQDFFADRSVKSLNAIYLMH
jgi:hypothetical protein